MEQVWEQTLGGLKGHLSNENFETWLRPVQFGGIEGESIVLRIPNQFFAEWITAHYLDMILATLQTTAGDTPAPKKVRWELDETLREKAQAARESTPPPAPRAPRATPRAPENADLNPKYRFKNFVVGPANQLAHAASVACGSDPGRRYNPLFIYGGVGLGKTHLVNAIGHAIMQRNPRSRILYVSAEQFTNEFIWSLQNHQINTFRERYRTQCDVLLMDDIQFLAGREQTQEEFFHTFNALYTHIRSPRCRNVWSAASSPAWSPTSRRQSSIPVSPSCGKRPRAKASNSIARLRSTWHKRCAAMSGSSRARCYESL
jgi:chromosomal replication initiator protein